MPILVQGLREIETGLALVAKETERELRTELKQVAEPVKRQAETLAVQTIPRMQFSPPWSKMRIGSLRKGVYIAPRQRGVRHGDDPRSRPSFAGLLMRRAMEPALEHNEAQVEQQVGRILDGVAADFNRG